MNQPTVCTVMLVNGREAMVRRAVRAFEAQTYKERMLLIWDTGSPRVAFRTTEHNIWWWTGNADSIGNMRNAAAAWICDAPGPLPDIILHWDSDDWSHPRRIEEQVAFLVASGKECVGYREALFWDERGAYADAAEIAQMLERGKTVQPEAPIPWGRAYLYRNVRHDYAIGASLCYWRDVWERQPFPDLPKRKGGTGEDSEWIKGVRCEGVSAISSPPDTLLGIAEAQIMRIGGIDDRLPRMICGIHGSNTMDYSDETLANSPSWERVPQWDEHCRGVMEL